MNLNLLDPKFIMLAGVVILVVAVLAWMYLQKHRSTTADVLWPRVHAGGAGAGVRTKSGSQIRGSREEG
jgi:hypothetical protein